MGADREAKLQDEVQAVLAKLRVLEFALLEVLQGYDKDQAACVAAGLRARVNEWSLTAGPSLTTLVDEMASAQLSSLLSALDEAPSLPEHLVGDWPPMQELASAVPALRPKSSQGPAVMAGASHHHTEFENEART